MNTYRCNGYVIRERAEADGRTVYEVMSKEDAEKVIAWSYSFSDAANFARSN